MPLTDGTKGTNADGSKNDDFGLSHYREYLAKHYTAGDFITSGPQNTRVGGVITMEADNREAVDVIIVDDSFNINGIANYQIVEFTPTMFSDSSFNAIFG